MTPERTQEVLRALAASLGNFIAEVEEIEAQHPGMATHLLGTMRQCRLSLIQLIQRDDGRDRVD